MTKWISAAALITSIAGVQAAEPNVISNSAQADAARKKPLQRCDQLKDKAELDCLVQARERIVEARKKRESASEARAADKKATRTEASDTKAGPTTRAPQKSK